MALVSQVKQNSPKIVVMCGYKGAGKDFCASFLTREHNFIRLAFADTLKDYCSSMYQIPRHYFDDIKLKDKIIDSDDLANGINGMNKFSPRDLCINVGTDYRARDINYWVKEVCKKMEEILKSSPNQCFVITDCRFPNELAIMKNMFGPENCLSLWIHRFDKPPSSDPSENSLTAKDCDVIFDNTKLFRVKNLMDTIDKFLTDYEVKN